MSASFHHFHQQIEAHLQQGELAGAQKTAVGALSHPSLRQDALLWLSLIAIQRQTPTLAQAALTSLMLTTHDAQAPALLSQVLPTPQGRAAAAQEAYRQAPHEQRYLQSVVAQWPAHADKHALSELLQRHAPHLRTPAALAALASAYITQMGPRCGATWLNGEQLCGWCLTATATPPTLTLAQGEHRHRIGLKRAQTLNTQAGDHYAWWFTLNLEGLNDTPISVSVSQSTDATSQALMGSPLQMSASTPPALTGKQAQKSGKKHAAPVTVLVPVYAGYEETLACLHSVLASQGANQTPFRLLVVNDASPDAKLAEQLTLMAEQKRLILHHQPINRGFIDTVNLGLTQAAGHDVILLNADTLVHGDWVDRLRETAYRTPTTASVTPLTNNGELMSLLGPCDPAEALTSTQLARLDKAAKLANGEKENQSVAIHTGCGFCLYLRHDALAELGGLDPTLTRGYGEESDWCYRAEARGWQHQGALNVVVAHQGGISFGDEKRLRVKQNLQIINARYPESSTAFDTCLQQDLMRPGRERVIRHWLYQQPLAALWHPASADGVLNVWPSLAQAQRDSRARGVSMARTSGQLILEGSAPHAWRLRYHLPAERQVLLQDLQAFGIHRFAATTSTLKAWLSSALPELPTQNAHGPGLPRPTPPNAPMTQGLVIAFGEPESLNHPAFIRWVAALERQQSTLRVLHTRPLPTHHPLASSGRLFYAPLSHHGDDKRTELLIEHLPLTGALVLDECAATQADLAWLTTQRALPVLAIPAEATQPRVGATA